MTTTDEVGLAPVDANDLLERLRTVLARLEEDLLARSADPGVQAALAAEHARESAARRTADPLPVWTRFRVTQIAAAWVLSLLFVRTLEDRGLVPHRLKASDDHRAQLRALAPYLGDRDYLLLVFRELCRYRGVRDVFDPAHNPVWTLGPSQELASDLLTFARSESGLGGLDFSGDTRFLGDVYERLDEGVRKRYALLQTPDFVEEFILDRTLTPALEERGVDGLTVIDPTCGSGHFLLGSFLRLLAAWQQKEPSAGAEVWAFKAIHQVYGADINPYAVAIARFRLVLAYADAAGLTDLDQASDLRLNVAVADSLLPVEGSAQQELAGVVSVQARTSWKASPFAFSQGPEAQRVLGGRRFDVVVGNPPYITVKDKVLRDEYRRLYSTAHREYQLVVPFVERFFGLARASGWVGAIVGNGFMKRLFGQKLIEEYLPGVDLTQVVDTSGAYIPGHGTPTVIVFGRARRPTLDEVLAVMGKRGEPTTPSDPAQGLVWTSIRGHAEEVGYEDEFMSVDAIQRTELSSHPWSLKGGGATKLKSLIESRTSRRLRDVIEVVGFTAMTRADDLYFIGRGNASRLGLREGESIECVEGDRVRDWTIVAPNETANPFSPDGSPVQIGQHPGLMRLLWPHRAHLWLRREPNGNHRERGATWWEWSRFHPERLSGDFLLSFAFVATHNHFVLDRGGKVFNRSAPIIKLPPDATEEDHLALLGYLNSSTACFWMKQVSHPKSSASQRHHPDPARYAYEFAGTGMKGLPLPDRGFLQRFASLSRPLDRLAHERERVLSYSGLVEEWRSLETADSIRGLLRGRWTTGDALREQMVMLQEEIDWLSYVAFDLADSSLLQGEIREGTQLRRGHRAIELLEGRVSVVRKNHQLVPTEEAEVPSDTPLPDELSALSDRRKRAIRESKWLRLVETRVHKRLWRDTERNETEFHYRERMDRQHLERMLLDRVEAEVEGSATTHSIRQLVRTLSRDPKVLAIAEVQADRPDPDLEQLLTDLVQSDAVPYLAAHRYKEKGIEKYRLWQQTWDSQRAEDAWESASPATRGDRPEVPLPPKYGSGDFARTEFWSLRGKLDVPKERFISYPGVHDDDDPTPLLGWAGWDHAARMDALGALVEAETDPEKLVPLLAGMQELLPWVQQWHGDDDRYGTPLGELWRGHLEGLLTSHGLTPEKLRAWRPPKKTRGRRKKGGTS